MKKVVILVAFVFVISQFCLRETEGFALNKISKDLLKNSVSEVEEKLLANPYHYLAKGGQSYVFLSSDGRYVIKFFRGSKLGTLRYIQRIFPFFEGKIQRQENRLLQTLSSYVLAHKHLKEETGILGVHLDASQQLHSPLILVDKLGIAHQIDPNLYPFVIQKRATLLKKTMDELDASSAKGALKELFSLLRKRMQKGIEDADPNLTKNFGFCDLQPIQIDGGCFSIGSPLSLEKLHRSKEDLQHWINANHPELSQDLQEMYEEFVHEAL